MILPTSVCQLGTIVSSSGVTSKSRSSRWFWTYDLVPVAIAIRSSCATSFKNERITHHGQIIQPLLAIRRMRIDKQDPNRPSFMAGLVLP